MYVWEGEERERKIEERKREKRKREREKDRKTERQKDRKRDEESENGSGIFSGLERENIYLENERGKYLEKERYIKGIRK